MIHNTSKVDVHVLIRSKSQIPKGKEDLYEKWKQQSLESLKSPVINVHYISEVDTLNFYFLRKEGFSRGSSEYVSFTNDDDIVLGDPFSVCVEELEKDPHLCGVYTNSYIRDEEQNTQRPFFTHTEWSRSFHLSSPRPIHEIVVIRRHMIEKAFHAIESLMKQSPSEEINHMLINAEQTIYTAVAAYGDWKFLSNEFAFVWRKHVNGRHNETFPRSRLRADRLLSIKKHLLSGV